MLARPLASLVTLAAGLAVLAAGPAVAQEAAPVVSGAPCDHVILVSVDGLRPEFYLDRTWPAPVLQQLAAEGARATRVRSVFPTVTYPSHTTLVTGALPARHGIAYNSPFEPGGATGAWYWEASAIRTPTLWDAVRASGRESAAVSWPVTVGAPIAWNLPEVWHPGDTDPLAACRAATTPGLWDELEREVTGRMTTERFDLEGDERDDLDGMIAGYQYGKHRPALLAIHLLEVDHWQHEEGRDGPHVRRALAAADRSIGRLVDAIARANLGPRTALIVTGDHGFMDLHLTLAPNVWLVQAGLRGPAKDGGPTWRARFHTAGASAFLHLRDPADPEAVARVRELLAALPSGVRRQFRVLERADLDRLGAAPEAALALTPALGVGITGAAQGDAVLPNEGGTHGPLCDVPELHTGFVGWGPAFRKGAVVSSMALEDVAPLIARLLGVKLEPVDGVAPLGVLRQAE